MMLETFSTLPFDELKCKIPDFLDVTQEVTGDPAFSMFNLALKSEWTVKDFCRRLVLKVMKCLQNDSPTEMASVLSIQNKSITFSMANGANE